MATLKCKMCGGDLTVEENATVCECEYCGTKQTVPNVDDEKILKLYERANRLRMSCEFDKAATVYESIIAEKDTDAEAYWGLVLCKFGIEYVDDPATGDKIPTCHRSSFDSVMDDSDFEMVMENADSISKSVYREQAKQIEEIRKGIIEVSGKEQPYDIFICYKETDENGDRTIDSVIAQDVYDALTDKGYRVFFSRITLEDKLGTEYEPYIFAALNSAKVMLAFGTKYDYYNAVWVKNEWSRFIKLMAKDKGKYLIPCFKDIDAYDMPKEFAKLQSQDMGKVGAIQDLVRGIDKLTGRTEKVVQAQTAQSPYVGAGDALTQRGMMYLEDGNLTEAKNYFNRALDTNPTDSNAYFGLFLISVGVTSEAQLEYKKVDFDRSKDFARAIQFANPQNLSRFQALKNANQLRWNRTRLVAILKKHCSDVEIFNKREAAYKEKVARFETAQSIEDYMQLKIDFQDDLTFKDSKSYKLKCEDIIKETKIQEEERIKEHDYNELITMVENASTVAEYESAIANFSYLQGYKDAKKYIDLSGEKIQEIIYQEKVQQFDKCCKESDYEKLITEFESNINYKESSKYIDICKEKIAELKREKNYQNKIARMDRAESILDYEELLKEFAIDAIYKDSKKYIGICEDKIKEIKKKQEEEKQTAYRREERQAKARKKKIAIGILSGVALTIMVIVIISVMNNIVSQKREEHSQIAAQKKYDYQNATVGEYVYYGKYNDKALEWKVLAKEDNRILVITKEAVVKKSYNNTYTDITWEKCTLRNWLNNDFINLAFNSDEQSRIVTTNVSADKNPDYATNPGNATQDKVFLLSIDEANNYFKSDSDRLCEDRWWLRSPGKDIDFAVVVESNGTVYYKGILVNSFASDDIGIRPAMWINLES